MRVETKIDRAVLKSDAVKTLQLECGIPAILSAIFASRGYDTPDKAKVFMTAEADTQHSPFLLPDMEAAAQRIKKAIDGGEQIVVYGDYDADGVTATALVVQYLRDSGLDPLFHLPDRFTEGYGISKEVLKRLPKGGGLIITVDTGSKANEEISFARELGYDTVVTDHHECPDVLPECAAVVNPMRRDSAYPFKGLAGVGVAFKLICAVESLYGDPVEVSTAELIDDHADLIAIGTVADVMPIVDENRFFVKKGLSLINAGSRLGVRELVTAVHKQKGRSGSVNVTGIGFQLGPRINAAGRMASAGTALELMLTKDELRAAVLADELCKYNEERQRIENKIFDEALNESAEYKNDPFLLLAGEGWHEGVIGIAASRICELCGKPTILLSVEGDRAKGSGRSVEGVNLVRLLENCSPLLARFGGHEMAAGLSLGKENIDALRARLCELCADLPQADKGVYSADLELLPAEANLPLAGCLSSLEPCGNGNETPVFYMREMTVCDVFALSDGKHTKLTLERDGVNFTALCFGVPTDSFIAARGEKIDVLFNLSINDYQGRQSIQFIVSQFDLSESSQKEYEKVLAEYEAIARGERALGADELPTKDDFKAIYLFLRYENGKKGVSITFMSGVLRLSPLKIFICLDAFAELGLLIFEYKDDRRRAFTYSLPEVHKKADLFSASIFQKQKF